MPMIHNLLKNNYLHSSNATTGKQCFFYWFWINIAGHKIVLNPENENWV